MVVKVRRIDCIGTLTATGTPPSLSTLKSKVSSKCSIKALCPGMDTLKTGNIVLFCPPAPQGQPFNQF